MVKYRAFIGIGVWQGKPVIDENWLDDINHHGYLDEDCWKHHLENYDKKPWAHYRNDWERDRAFQWYAVEVEYDEVTGRINAIDPNETA